MSSIGTVKMRGPKISSLLYQTTGFSMKVPVNIAFTTKKGIKITTNVRKYLLIILDLSSSDKTRANINIIRFIRVYNLSNDNASTIAAKMIKNMLK